MASLTVRKQSGTVLVAVTSQWQLDRKRVGKGARTHPTYDVTSVSGDQLCVDFIG